MSDAEDWVLAIIKTVTAGAGRAVIEWLKRRLNSKTAKAADTLATDPNNGSAKKILTESLQMELEKCPSLAGELRTLLRQAGVNYAPQTSTASGGSTIIQIQGNNNRK